MSIVDKFRSTAATMSDGFFAGIFLDYALKKVITLLAVILDYS